MQKPQQKRYVEFIKKCDRMRPIYRLPLKSNARITCFLRSKLKLKATSKCSDFAESIASSDLPVWHFNFVPNEPLH